MKIYCNYIISSSRYLFLLPSLILYLNSDSNVPKEWNNYVDFECSFFHEKSKNIVKLDILGNRHVYDNRYRFIIQAIEGHVYNNVIKISKSTENSSTKDINSRDSLLSTKDLSTMRVSRLKYKFFTQNGNKYFIVINNKSWPIAKMVKRVKSNRFDGDAHFILGVYYTIREEYYKAIDLLQNIDPDSIRYTFFNADDMYEWFGYTYYRLGLTEKGKKAKNKYISVLQDEQQVYVSALSDNPKSDNLYHFKYFYALSFIDLGFYLEGKGIEKKDKSIIMPDSILITSANESFEYAIKLLKDIENPKKEIYETLIFLHKKLGQLELADKVSRVQEEARLFDLFIKKQKRIGNEILKKIDAEEVYKDEFEPWYQTELDYKYTPKNIKQLKNSDSLIEWKFRMVTKNLIQSHPEADTLTQSSIDQLTKIINQKLYNPIKKRLFEFESDYCFQVIKEAYDNKQYLKVVLIVDSFTTVIQLKEKKAQVKKMKTKSQKRIEAINEKIVKQQEKNRSVDQPEPEPENETLSNQADTLNELTDTTQQAAQAVPLYKKIGILIDELVGKGDYIGAYRGLRAYEQLLKNNFTIKEIDNTIREIENVIEKKYGKRHLKKLKKELDQ